jgi:hypothetical protein
MKKKRETFGMLMDPFWETPAWRAMSKGAMWLYFLLRRHYNPKNDNNGRIFLSQREAARLLNSHRDYIARWFRELQHFGFIVMTSAGRLGLDGKGRAPRWHLPELPYKGESPTKNYLAWNGVPFTDRPVQRNSARPTKGNPRTKKQPKSESRPTNAGHPGPQMRAMGNGAYGRQKRATSEAHKCGPDLEGGLHKRERRERRETDSKGGRPVTESIQMMAQRFNKAFESGGEAAGDAVLDDIFKHHDRDIVLSVLEEAQRQPGEAGRA